MDFHFLLHISTDDASRVVLSVPDAVGSDYINASFINVCMHKINYLIMQTTMVSGIQNARVMTHCIPVSNAHGLR